MKTIYEKLQTKSITTTIVTAMTIMMSIAAIIMTTTSFDSPMLFDIGNINNHKAYAQINTIIGTTGDDTLSAPPGFNRIHGDTDASLNDYAHGGNDQMTGGTGYNYMSGDAGTIYDNSQGGDDEMTGGTGYNEIYGDAGRIYSNTGIPTPGTIYDNSQGGDDILIGGEGVNVMFGDAGTSIYDNS